MVRLPGVLLDGDGLGDVDGDFDGLGEVEGDLLGLGDVDGDFEGLGDVEGDFDGLGLVEGDLLGLGEVEGDFDGDGEGPVPVHGAPLTRQFAGRPGPLISRSNVVDRSGPILALNGLSATL
jgi:hypothetical protein